jgi:hypothetical protein
VDVSLLVLDEMGQPVGDLTVLVRAVPLGDFAAVVECPATTEAATNKLLYAAPFDLPAAGRWLLEIDLAGPRGPAHVACEVEAADPLPRWAEVWVWVVLPAVPILLFAVAQRGKKPAAGR